MHRSNVLMLSLRSMFEQLSMASLEFSITCLPQKLNTDERARKMETGGQAEASYLALAPI